MTKQQIKICYVVVHKQKLGRILSALPQFDYISLQEALPPRSLDFSDDAYDDDTVVTLSPLMRAKYDRFWLKILGAVIPILLSAAGVVISIVKP